jgi:hypothetical protein
VGKFKRKTKSMLNEKTEVGTLEKTKLPLYCSFCGRNDNEVENMIAGPTVFICNICVDLCTEIISSNKTQEIIGGIEEYGPFVDPMNQISVSKYR